MRAKAGIRMMFWCIVALILGSTCGFASGMEATLAMTPPMGWNSFNHFGCRVTEDLVRQQAQAMATNGMKQAGYRYVNIDACWQGGRDTQGNMEPNSNFPNIKALSDYIHSLGLKFGIYSSPGPKDCGNNMGSYGHELQDARAFASWGVDYLKYDWCSGDKVYQPSEMQAAYRKMYDALRSTGRPIVFSLCQYGSQQVWRWGPSVGGNLWRTTMDISDDYAQMAFNGFEQNGLQEFAGPGHWNDPDMLEIGNGHMSLNEERTHMSLWCILAAPLLAGNDLAKMSAQTLDILTNREVIAVDQDASGIQGHRVAQEGPLQVWMKPLSDGNKAVGLFNCSVDSAVIKVNFGDVGIHGRAKVRDLWKHEDLGTFDDSFSAKVPPHGVVMLKVNKSSS